MHQQSQSQLHQNMVLNWQRRKTILRTKRWTPPKVPAKIKKPLTRKLSDVDDEDYGPPGPDELDLHRGYEKPKLSKPFFDDEVSDYVAIRLAVIRLKTLQRFRETVI